jgi:hypothetical protein
MGKRGSASNNQGQDDNAELIVDLETEPVATTASRLQRAADALANQLCTESAVHWASVGVSTAQRVLHISYGVDGAIPSHDDAARCATDAVEKLRQRSDFPDIHIANVSVRERTDTPIRPDIEDEPTAEVVGTLIDPREAGEIRLPELEQGARELVRELRRVGERTDAESIERCLGGGKLSMERLRALRQQLILLRDSHTPFLLGDERQLDRLVMGANLAVARFSVTGKRLPAGPESRLRLQKTPAKVRAKRR